MIDTKKFIILLTAGIIITGIVYVIFYGTFAFDPRNPEIHQSKVNTATILFFINVIFYGTLSFTNILDDKKS